MKRAPKRLWLVLVLFCFAGILKATLPPITIGSWTGNTASLAQPRANGSAVLLANGSVLFTGGDVAGVPQQSAEVFGPDGSVSSAGTMNVARSHHFAVVLSDGHVLVGGGTSGGGTTNSTEIYDPSANIWTASSPMTSARANATAAVLQDGRVVISGGDNSGAPSNTIEIYDPASGSFSFAGTMSASRTQQAMAVLQDGRVLIVGGSDGTNPLSSSDIFDPSSGNVSAGPALTTARYAASATTLLNGQVAVIGGAGSDGNGGTTDLASIEVFDPASSAFTTASASLATAREGHQAFLLPNNNNVLIVGGTTPVVTSSGTTEQAIASSELFTAQASPSNGAWSYSVSATGAMNTARAGASGSANQQNGPTSKVTPKPGIVIVGGGTDATGATLASTEAYGYPTVQTDQADYPPGTTVNITGSGFQPNENVTITLVESPLIDTHGPYTVTADGNGNISDSSFTTDLHDLNVRFSLSAVGSQSGLEAQNTFTDAAGDTTTTAVTCSPSPVAAGSATTCTATVNNTQAGAPNGFPQGTATFQFNGPAGTFSFSPSTGVCTLTQIPTTNNSSCTVTLTANDAAGGNVKANFNNANNNWKNSVSGNFPLTVSAGTFSQLQLLVPGETAAPGTATGFTGTPTAQTAGTPFNVTVNAVDANWNPVSSTDVVHIASSDTNATPPANAALVGGTKTFSVTLKTAPSQTITASDVTHVTIGSNTSPSIQVNAAAANKLAFSVQPTDTNTNTNINPNVAVQVEDTFGNTVNASGRSITLAIGTNPGSGTLNCGTNPVSTNSSGLAVFPNCQINNPGTGYTLSATASGNPVLTSASSNTFNIISPISKLGFITGPFTGAINQCLGPITVQTQNTGGTGTNPSSPVQADLSITSGGTGAFFSDAACGSAITNVSIPTSANSASFFFKGTSTGSPTTIQATDHAGVLTFATQDETINARSTTTVVSFSTNSVTYGNSTNATVTVTDTDANGTKSFPTGTVSVASNSGDTIAAPCTLASTATAGVSTCTVQVTPTHASIHTISASYPGDTAHSSSSDTGEALTVNPATVTVTFTAADKYYDGNTTAAVSNCAIATGKVGNDAVTCTVAGGTFATKNASASAQTVTATATLGGADAANYTVTNPVTTTAKINQATATVVVAAYSVPYDGHSHTATVTSITGVNGETGATVGTVDVSNTTHTNAGTYASDYWFFTGAANYNDIGNTTITDSIAKANAAISVTPYTSATVTYDGSPHTATVTSITGVNGEMGVTVGTVDVSHTTHTDAGTYATDYWFFTGAANYNDIGHTTITDSIAKANAAISVTPYTSATVTYDGSPHTATVTSITGVNGEMGVTVGTVDVSHTTHTDAGTYATDYWFFTGTANYNDIGHTTITDSIAKANAAISVTPYTSATVTYDGSPHTATVTSITGVNGEMGVTVGTVDVSHTTHTDAGTYATDYWFFTGTANYNDIGHTTITDSIAKANAAISVTPYTSATVTYDGSPHTATVTSITGVNGEMGATVGTVDVSHTTHTAAGTYASDYWSFTGTANYNDIGNTTIIDSIAKATATVVVTPYTSPGTTYTGLAHTATVTSITGVNGEMGATVGTVDVSHTTHTAAGTYASDYWNFTGTANYNDIGNMTIIDSIAKATATVVVTPYTSPGTTYTGLAHTATVTSITGVNGEMGATVGTVDVSHTTHTAAGTYASDYWSFTGTANYNDIGNMTIIDSIAKATATVVVTPYTSPGTTYTGLAHTATVTSITGVNGEMGATVGTVDVSHTTHTAAGTYASDYWNFTGTANYNDIGNMTIIDSIAKATATVVVTPYLGVPYNGNPHTATVTSITGVNGEMGATVGAVDVNHTTHTNPGTYASDYWFFTGTANYNDIGNTTITDSIGYGACSVGQGGVILPPINSDGTSVYSRKGGSTIPVKFNVCGANGAPLTDPALVFAGTGGVLTMTGAMRGTITAVDEITSYDLPDAGFTWDGQQWHFNLATTNLSSPATYTFTINLAYGHIVFVVGLK